MDLFNQLEAQYGLPSGLLDAVWAQESSRGRAMLSPKGAKGHMGFMDPTAAQYGVKDPNDLTQAATGAARMYADLLKQYGGDLPRALAGYNWGQGNLSRKGFEAAPSETRNYIKEVTSAMGQPQARAQQSQDAPSDDWAALAQQFSPAQPARPAQETDPWNELVAKFAQPTAPAVSATTPARAPAQFAGQQQPAAMAKQRILASVIPFVGPAMAALDLSPDLPALVKGVASGFADLGSTLINRGTKSGADMLAGIDDPFGLIDPRLKRPPAGLGNLVTGEKPMTRGRPSTNLHCSQPW